MSTLDLTTEEKNALWEGIKADPLHKRELNEAIFMGLLKLPASDKAISFVSELIDQLWNDGDQEYGPSKAFKAAVGAVCADLITAGKGDQRRFSYRSFSPNKFKESPVGYTVFKKVVDRGHGLGLIEFSPLNREVEGKATRLRATPAFFTLAASYGVEPTDDRWHFKHRSRPKEILAALIHGGWLEGLAGVA